MLTKDILAKPTNNLWAIAPNGRSNHEKSFEDIFPDRIKYARRVNEYQYAVSSVHSYDINSFTRTFSGSKYGYLVGYDVLTHDENGNEITKTRYFVAKARDFIGDAKEYQDAWVIEQARLDAEAEAWRIEKEKRDAEYQRKRAIADAKDAQANEQAQNTANKIAKFIEQLIGSQAREASVVKVYASGQWTDHKDGVGAEAYKITQQGEVKIPVQEFQRLMNKFIELSNN